MNEPVTKYLVVPVLDNGELSLRWHQADSENLRAVVERTQLLTEGDVAIYRFSRMVVLDPSKLLADEVRDGWFEVWSYKGSKRNSFSTYMAQQGGRRMFFALDLRVISEPTPYGDQTLRALPCRRPSLDQQEGTRG